MKFKKSQLFLTRAEAKTMKNVYEAFQNLSTYVLSRLHFRELLTTKQVMEMYHVTRTTLYRIRKAGLLVPVLKYRTYYYDAKEARAFFAMYRAKQ